MGRAAAGHPPAPDEAFPVTSPSRPGYSGGTDAETVGPPSQGKKKPAPAACIVCEEKWDHVWDTDVLPTDPPDHVPEPGWVLDAEVWGTEAFHCSRYCYVRGAEYARRQGESA